MAENSAGQPLESEDIEKILAAEMVGGLEYVYGADNIAAERDRNYDYYRGIMNDLPAPPGRSRVVEPVIANYIGLMKPSLLRIFTSGRNVAEYVSPKPDLQHATRLVTRFINDVVFRKDNRGELMLSDWAEDALVQKLGVAMYWWEERTESKDEVLDNVPADQLLIMVPQIAQAGGELIQHTENPDGTHSIKVRTKINKSKCCIDVIPPEEFVISRDARNVDDAILRAHRTGAMVGDLIRAGYSADELEELPTFIDLKPYAEYKYNRNAAQERNPAASVDPALRKVAILRGILRCDCDGTGIKEWYVVAGGDEATPKLLEIQPYNDQVGFAEFCPEPMPHTVFGRCPADRLAGLQKIQTVLVRQANDNVFLSNTPQREVVMDWIIKPDQLINMAPGAPVLVKQPGAIREMSIPFVADKALLMIQYYDGQAEIASGVSRQTAGLDPDALTNQSATANANMVSAQQSRIEMIARTWAQGGMRKLFRGVFRCLKAYQDFARVEQIDGEPQNIDPRSWQGLEDLDVNINTGLGTGNRQADFTFLSAIAAKQEALLKELGPNNPIVNFQKLSKTYQAIAECGGMSYADNAFGLAANPDGSPWAPPPPPPPQPTPDAVLNAQTMLKIEQGKAAQKAQEDAADDQLKRDTTVATLASQERVAYRQQDLDAAAKEGALKVQHVELVVRAAEVDAENIRTQMDHTHKMAQVKKAAAE